VVQSEPDGARRCVVCDAAYRLGQELPWADGYALLPAAGGAEAAASLPGDMRLEPKRWRGRDAVSVTSFTREEAASAPYRPPAHVARITNPEDARYRHAGVADEEGEDFNEGDVMTFAHIGAEALEEVEGRILGRDLLGILKADVDFLGRIFAEGLGTDRSPARVAQLSRLMDGYFAERLPWLLAHKFPAAYTVYAGGDDFLLVLPWRFALPCALRLREDFEHFAGGNPNLTLSAGVAFAHPKQPLALVVEEAEEALSEAKAAGRNRLGVLANPGPDVLRVIQAKAAGRNRRGVLGRTLDWEKLRVTLDLAERLNARVREQLLPPTFLHRMAWFAARRARAEEAGEVRAADWNAKWRYQQARFLARLRESQRPELAALQALLDETLPPPGQQAAADPEIAITIALWRNR
jgi:CRISPR-associated protein Csm1